MITREVTVEHVIRALKNAVVQEMRCEQEDLSKSARNIKPPMDVTMTSVVVSWCNICAKSFSIYDLEFYVRQRLH